MAEMEKLLISGGAFGKNNNLGDTFKKINNELAEKESGSQHQLSMEQKSGVEFEDQSDLDLPLHDNSKLMMESPGQNTFVQNQIN